MLKSFKKSSKKDLFTYQNLSSKTSSLRLDSQEAGAKRLDKCLKRMHKGLSLNEKAAHAQKTQTAHTRWAHAPTTGLRIEKPTYKKTCIKIPSLDAQMLEGGAADRKEVFLQATGGLSTTGQLVDSPK